MNDSENNNLENKVDEGKLNSFGIRLTKSDNRLATGLTIGIFSPIGAIWLYAWWLFANIAIADDKISKEYNLIKNNPEYTKVVNSYRLYDGGPRFHIPSIAADAAKNELDKWNKKSDLYKKLTYYIGYELNRAANDISGSRRFGSDGP